MNRNIRGKKVANDITIGEYGSLKGFLYVGIQYPNAMNCSVFQFTFCFVLYEFIYLYLQTASEKNARSRLQDSLHSKDPDFIQRAIDQFSSCGLENDGKVQHARDRIEYLKLSKGLFWKGKTGYMIILKMTVNFTLQAVFFYHCRI